MLPHDSSRRMTHRSGSSRAAPSRPCLPQVEQLGDRIMLSVGPQIVVGDVGSDDILVALVQGQLPILKSQLEVLKLGGALTGTDASLKVEFLKLTDGFLKLQDAVYDFGDVLIKGELKLAPAGFDLTTALNKATTNITDELAKLETMAFSWGKQSPMLPAVQDVATETMALVNALLQPPPGGGVDTQAQSLQFLKLSDEFLKINQDIIKIGSDTFLGQKINNGELEYLQIKMNDILITGAKLGDEQLQKILIGLSTDTVNLLSPADGGLT